MRYSVCNFEPFEREVLKIHHLTPQGYKRLPSNMACKAHVPVSFSMYFVGEPLMDVCHVKSKPVSSNRPIPATPGI